MSGGNSGWFSKFQERLKKMKIIRSKKKKLSEEEIHSDVVEKSSVNQSVEKNTNKQTDTVHVDDRDEFVRNVLDDIYRTAGDRKSDKKYVGVDDNEHIEDIKQTGNNDNVREKIIDNVRGDYDIGISVPRAKSIGIDDSKEHHISNQYVGAGTEDNTEQYVRNPNIKPGASVVVENNHEQKDTVNSNNNDTIVRNHSDINDDQNKKLKSHYVSDLEKRKRRVSVGTDDEREEELEKIEQELLDKIRESFEDKLDEIDVLESELFLLQQEKQDVLVMKKIKELKVKINSFIDELNKIIDQYNTYKRNYYIDNVLDIDDNVIVDDLIDFRTLLDSADDEKRFVKQYKKFEEFEKLYRNLKSIAIRTDELQEETIEKTRKIADRDKKYKEIQNGMFNIASIQKSCEEEMDKQNEFFIDLMEKVNKINKEEYVTHHLRGLGDVVGMSLRYVGMMLLSPFRGTVPGIGAQTLATRMMLGNMYRNLHWEEENHVRYSAIDYDSDISKYLTDVRYTSHLIDDTLDDINRFKEQFMLQYDSRIPGYDETLKKIDKLQHIIVRNQNKVHKIEKNLVFARGLNEKKLTHVQELNRQH